MIYLYTSHTYRVEICGTREGDFFCNNDRVSQIFESCTSNNCSNDEAVDSSGDGDVGVVLEMISVMMTAIMANTLMIKISIVIVILSLLDDVENRCDLIADVQISLRRFVSVLIASMRGGVANSVTSAKATR